MNTQDNERTRAQEELSSDGETAQISFMITRAQKLQLRQLGYDEETIRQMTPVQAHRLLAEG